MKADRIVVVDQGRIIELGTHAQLVARRGRYAAMYATWISQAEARAA
jgi:ABC-type multidrug transport system fused ATPase/permease subunit